MLVIPDILVGKTELDKINFLIEHISFINIKDDNKTISIKEYMVPDSINVTAINVDKIKTK